MRVLGPFSVKTIDRQCLQDGLSLDSSNFHSQRQELVEYSCPVHPKVRKAHPGLCPICGMALDPVTVLEGDHDAVKVRSVQNVCMRPCF